MSPSGGFINGLYKVVAGQFGDVELMFEVQGSVGEFPVSFGSLRDPWLPSFIVHGSKGLADNRV